MEYGGIIKDALGIAWRKRHLWAFGFFAGIGAPNFDTRLAVDRMGDLRGWLVGNPGMALLLVFLLLGVALVFWILQVISQGGLVRGVWDLERSAASGFEECLSHGLRNFWRVFGLQLLLLASVLGVVALLAGPPVLLMLFGGTAAKVVGVAWLVAAILPAIAALVGVGLLWNYALRFCVLTEIPVLRCVASSWGLVKAHFTESVILFAISLGIGLALGMAVVLAFILLAIPFVILGVINLVLGLVPGLMIGVPAFILSICVLGVFQSAYWTLGFARLPAVKDNAGRLVG